MAVTGFTLSRNNNEIPRQAVGTPVFANLPQRSFNGFIPDAVRARIKAALFAAYDDNVDFTGFIIGWNEVPDAFGPDATHPVVGIVFSDFSKNEAFTNTTNENKVNIQMIVMGQRYTIKLSSPSVNPVALEKVYMDGNGLITNSSTGTLLVPYARFVPNTSVEDFHTVKNIAEDGSSVALIEFNYGY